MRNLRFSVLVAGALVGLSSICGAADVKLNGQHFTLPEDFTIELVAGPPLIDRPIMGDFDEQGRLYVAESAGVNDNLQKQLETLPHRILRLEDTDGDGKFDKKTVFADKIMFPEGVLYFDGAVYVGAPPTIWKLEDTDGDGVADKRTEWFKENAISGCGNEVHGPYLGPDGRIYWCKGGFSKLNIEIPGKKPITDRAAHIFRCRPDGSGLEAIMSGGMDNPVEIAFTPAGEALFTTTFYFNPEAGKRDGVVHAIYGGVYPKVHDVIDGLKRTGDLMPILSSLGPAASSGLMRYSSKVIGADYQNNFFSTSFNLRKVIRHVLTPAGGTFTSQDSDFLVSDNTDFHPTDIIEDADGSLLVIDTGGWYKLCCPTSQLAKPDVLGAIYRIRKNGAPKVADPYGKTLALKSAPPETLVKHLNDKRPAVTREVLFQLSKRGESAIPALQDVLSNSPSSEARRNAVWALTRLNSQKAQSAVRTGLKDSDQSVRQAAARSAGLNRDLAAEKELINLLASPSQHVVRTAAAALGRLGNSEAVPALLTAASGKSDRTLEHSLIYALIEINNAEKTRAGLTAMSSYTRRAALIAVDQMDSGDLKADEVAALLSSNDPVLKETAIWITSRHSEWGSQLAEYFRNLLQQRDSSSAQRAELQKQLATFARDPAVQETLVSALSSEQTPKENRLVALRAMAASGLQKPPQTWIPEISRALRGSDRNIKRQAIAVARSFAPQKDQASPWSEELLKIGSNNKAPAQMRLDSLAAAGPISQLSQPAFEFLLSRLDSEVPPLDRSSAATVLIRSKLTPDQLSELAKVIKTAGPMEITQLLAAFEQSNSDDVGLKLVSALKESKGLGGLRPDIIMTRLSKYSPAIREQGAEISKSLKHDSEAQKAKLDELEKELKSGDIRRGQAVFNSPAAACSSCHAIGYVGGKVGPDLTRIGSIRTERDLLESIVYPSASFVRSFEPVTIQTKDGEQHSGIIKREAADHVLLTVGAGIEERIGRNDIVEMRPGTVSIMPEGLDQQLTKQQIADLITFLKSLK